MFNFGIHLVFWGLPRVLYVRCLPLGNYQLGPPLWQLRLRVCLLGVKIMLGCLGKPLMDRLSAQTTNTKIPVLTIFFRHTNPSGVGATNPCNLARSSRTETSKRAHFMESSRKIIFRSQFYYWRRSSTSTCNFSGCGNFNFNVEVEDEDRYQ